MKNANSDVLEKYLLQVERYLKYLPVSERTDILSEVKNSFYERLECGQTEHEIIDKMEDPKIFAANFIEEFVGNNDKFSWKNFMSVIGFYSIASMTWLAIIPILATLSVSFFFSSGVSVLAGVVGLLKGIVHIPLIDNVKFIFFTYELEGVPALVLGLLLAIILLCIGILCWKLTIRIVRLINECK